MSKKLENTITEPAGTHFNVKSPLRINGKLFIPAVSYTFPSSWYSSLLELQEKGKLIITGDVVVFQNGKPVDGTARAKETKVFKGL